MRGEVAAVSCPSCGAGLMALGGGRVVLQVCAHCGAALDAVDNYRLLNRLHAAGTFPNAAGAVATHTGSRTPAGA